MAALVQPTQRDTKLVLITKVISNKRSGVKQETETEAPPKSAYEEAESREAAQHTFIPHILTYGGMYFTINTQV